MALWMRERTARAFLSGAFQQEPAGRASFDMVRGSRMAVALVV